MDINNLKSTQQSLSRQASIFF